MTPRKRKLTLDAVHKVQRSALDAAFQLIQDAKKSKMTSKSLDKSMNSTFTKLKGRNSMAMFYKCNNSGDLRLSSDSELLIGEMRSAFCRGDWDAATKLLLFTAQTSNRRLIEFAQACYPVLVSQHPELKSRAKCLIEEALFAAGNADPSELVEKMFGISEGEEERESVQETVNKIFSARVARRRLVRMPVVRPGDLISSSDDSSEEGEKRSTDEEERWVDEEEEENTSDEEEVEWVDEDEDENMSDDEEEVEWVEGEEEENMRNDDDEDEDESMTDVERVKVMEDGTSELDEEEGDKEKDGKSRQEEEEGSEIDEGENIEETERENEHERSDVDGREREEDRFSEEDNNVKKGVSRLDSDRIESIRVLNQEDFMLGNDNCYNEKDDFW